MKTISNFSIELMHPELYPMGEYVVMKPWIWRCAFTVDQKRMEAAVLQDYEHRNPRQVALQFEAAINKYLDSPGN